MNFLMFSTNLTDIFISLFGWDFMQLLWDPLIAIFEFFEGLMGLDLTPIWEILFC